MSRQTEALWRSLRDRIGTPALAVGDGGSALVSLVAAEQGREVTSVGTLLAADGARSVGPEKLLQGHEMLVDLDVLFWPELMVDPVRLLKVLSKRHVVLAAWPGDVLGDRAVYSEPGRQDHYDEVIEDVMVVRSSSVGSEEFGVEVLA